MSAKPRHSSTVLMFAIRITSRLRLFCDYRAAGSRAFLSLSFPVTALLFPVALLPHHSAAGSTILLPGRGGHVALTAASAVACMHRSTFAGIKQPAQNEPVQHLVTGQYCGDKVVTVNGTVVNVGITSVDQMAGAIFGQTVMIGKVGTHSFCQRFAGTDDAFVFHKESSLSMCVTRLKRELCWNGE